MANNSVISISHLSLQYVGVPVKPLLLNGEPFNPTADPVAMAFMPTAYQVPGPSDWNTAIWAVRSSNVIEPYAAACLVGPGGTIELGIGTYIIYLKITDNPEIPVQTAGQLQIS